MYYEVLNKNYFSYRDLEYILENIRDCKGLNKTFYGNSTTININKNNIEIISYNTTILSYNINNKELYFNHKFYSTTTSRIQNLILNTILKGLKNIKDRKEYNFKNITF